MNRKPINRHITDDMRTPTHPDRWKWEYALCLLGMEWNSYQLKKNGYKGKPEDYYRQYRFAMNANTREELIDVSHFIGVTFVSAPEGLSVGIQGIEIRIDDGLPDGRVILIKGHEHVSFDWCGRINPPAPLQNTDPQNT